MTTRKTALKKQIQSKKKPKKLYKNAFWLPVETAVYVPSTSKTQKKIEKKILMKRVANVRKDLSNRYGGYTSYKAVGGYVMKKDGKLVKEKVVKVTAFATKKDFNKNKSAVEKKIKSWGKKWGQESVGYEHEGDLYYI